MKKSILIPLTAFMVVGGTSLVALPVQAHEMGRSTQLTQRVAQHFNLNQGEVESVVQEFRDARHQEMETKFADRLTQAVTEGTLTQEQKQLILDKHQELQEKREANREVWLSLSSEERRARKQAEVAAIKAWTSEHGIDLHWLRPAGKGGMHVFNQISS